MNETLEALEKAIEMADMHELWDLRDRLIAEAEELAAKIDETEAVAN